MSQTLTGDVLITNGEVGISQCVWCRHRAPGGRRCRAFPEGIPELILGNHHDHRRAFDGDLGVRFELEEVEIEFVEETADDRIVSLRVDVALEAARHSVDRDWPHVRDGIIDLDDVEFAVDAADVDPVD